MTDEELAAIKARADAASRGPWEWRTDEISGKQLWPVGETRDSIPVYEGCDYDTVMAMPERERRKQMPAYVLSGEAFGWEVEDISVDVGDPDAAFIAHARADVGLLVAECERYRAALQRIVQNCLGYGCDDIAQAALHDWPES